MNTDTGTMSPAEYRDLRVAIGMTQLQLAIALGVTPGTISKRERGEAPIDEEAVRALRHLSEQTDR